MITRYTITRKRPPPPEAFRRTVHEAEIACEWRTPEGEWLPHEVHRRLIKEIARHDVHHFADKPTEMGDNRLEELKYLEDGRWLVRITEAYLD